MSQWIVDPPRQLPAVIKIDMDDVRDRVRIYCTQLCISFHLYSLQKSPDLRIREALRLELFVCHVAVNERDCRDVRQAMISCLTRVRFPFFRFASDNFHSRIMTLNRDRFYPRKIGDFFAQKHCRWTMLRCRQWNGEFFSEIA